MTTCINKQNFGLGAELCTIFRTVTGDKDKFRRASRLTENERTRAAISWIEEMRLIQTEKSTTAFEKIFEHFAPKIKSYLLKTGADIAMAEECTQEVMVAVWHKAHLFDPTRANISTWIFTIARNKKIDAIRKQKRPEPEELQWEVGETSDQEAVFSLQQETEQLEMAMSKLPEKQRVLVERAFLSDMSHSEIADFTGLPLGTIKSRIRLALDRLRHSLA